MNTWVIKDMKGQMLLYTLSKTKDVTWFLFRGIGETKPAEKMGYKAVRVSITEISDGPEKYNKGKTESSI